MQKLAGIISESKYNELLEQSNIVKEVALNEDNLEVKNIAKQIYSFLTKNGVTTKLISSIPSAGSQGKQIGDKLTGGSNEGLVSYWDDPKTKQTVIEIQLRGDDNTIADVEKKFLSAYPNLEQYQRDAYKGTILFRVKEKTTAKGGLVGNTQPQPQNESMELEENAASNLELKNLAKKLYLGFKKLGAATAISNYKISVGKQGSWDDGVSVKIFSGDDNISLDINSKGIGVPKVNQIVGDIKKSFPEATFTSINSGTDWENNPIISFNITPGNKMS